MIKISNKNFDHWYNSLKNKPFILSNEGIGDAILSGNFAKYRNTAVVKYSDNSYRDDFVKKYFHMLGIDYYLLNKNYENFVLSNPQYLKIKQFDFHRHYNNHQKEKIMSSIYMMNYGFVKENNCDPDVVYICPMGSSNLLANPKRYINKKYFYPIVDQLIAKGNKVYLVGLEKDIKEYGFPNSCKWINSNHIIHSENEKEDIDIKTFMQMIANAKLAIASPTSFPLLSCMLNVKTLTIYRYNVNDKPIINNMADNFNSHFYNTNYFKTLKMVDYPQLMDFVDNM